MANGGRIKAKLAQWGGAGLRRRREPEWVRRRRDAATLLSLTLMCLLLAFGFGIVVTAIAAVLITS